MSFAKYTPRPAKQWLADALPTPRTPALRIADGKARAVVTLPKDKPVRDKSYRMRVASLPCIHCGIHGHSQAAHGPTLGARIKASDRELFPLCCVSGNDCHRKFDHYELFNRRDRAVMAQAWALDTRIQLGVP